MRSAVLLGWLMACGGRSDPPPPPPPPPKPAIVEDEPPGMELDEAKMDAEREKRSRPSREREAGVPPRKACSASCDLAHDPRAKTDCAETAPGVLVLGGMAHISCYAREVIIDCCPTIDPDNLVAVVAALGWQGATPEQHRAIGWLVLRAVQMRSIVEEVTDDFPPAATFTPPSAALANGEVTFDFWTRAYLHPRYFHHQVVFHADGTLADKELADLPAKEDLALKRLQAIEAAKAAGVISGSGSAK